MDESILEVRNLHTYFYTSSSVLEVVRGFDLSVKPGDIIGILGESGSGKTVSLSSVAKLIDESEGFIEAESIRFNQQELTKCSEHEMNDIRGKHIGFIFQNATQSLNPYKKIGRQIESVLRLHKIKYNKTTILNMLEEVGIEDPLNVIQMYPHQLSGGQNQRIMIAQTILMQPDILIADEPTSSIDADNIERVLNLLEHLCEKYNMALIMITHDFEVAQYICEKLSIMYGGLVVETGNTESILREPRHPYTKELMLCAKSLANKDKRLYTLKGTPLSPKEFRNQCPFLSRCNYVTKNCENSIPELTETASGSVRCYHPLRKT